MVDNGGLSTYRGRPDPHVPEKGWPQPKPRADAIGKQPKLEQRQEAHLVEVYRVGGHTTAELAELFASSALPCTAPSNGQEYRASKEPSLA